MTIRQSVLGVLVALVVCLAPSGVRAETFRDDDRHFQIEIPAGWKRISAADFTRFESAASAAASATGSGNVTYLAVYTKDPGGKITMPYLAVMFVAAPAPEGSSYEDVAKGFKAEVLQKSVGDVNRATNGVISGMTVGKSVVEAGRNRVLTTMDAKVGNGMMRANMVGYIGKLGLAQFVMYSKPEQAAKDAVEMEAMLGSFRFDEGWAFVPGSGMNAYRFGSLAGRIALYALIGAVVGGVIGVVRKMRR